MNPSIEILLEDAVSALRRRIADAPEPNPSDRAFVSFMLSANSPQSKLDQLAVRSATTFGKSRSYRDLAAIGYAAHVISLNDPEVQCLRHGLTWLCGRPAEIGGEPAAFFTDAVALLGVALGAASLGGAEQAATARWMHGFVPRAAKLPAVESWQRCLFSAALKILGANDVPLPNEKGVADVRTALRALSIAPPGANPGDAQADEVLTLELLKNQVTQDLPAVRAALRLAAFIWTRRAAPVLVPGRISSADLLTLLGGVPAGLRRWTWEGKARTKGGDARKWHVDNEYHVQNILYLLLAPIFPDLKDEEYFPSLGQKQPRADLFLPSMRLIIEVKFLRPGDKITKMIDAIGSDVSLYLQKETDYSGVIPFVWDDSRRVEEHTLLKAGLQQIRGVLAAVIIPRPGGMS